MKISNLCDEELYCTVTHFKVFCKTMRLNFEQSKTIYNDFYQEAQKRGLSNFPTFEELLWA